MLIPFSLSLSLSDFPPAFTAFKMLLLGGKKCVCFSQKCWMNFRPPCPSPIWCITAQAMPEVVGMWVCVVLSLWPALTMADNVLYSLDLNNWRNHESVSNGSPIQGVSTLLPTSKRSTSKEIPHWSQTVFPIVTPFILQLIKTRNRGKSKRLCMRLR